MSCDAAASAAFFLLTAFQPGQATAVLDRTPAVATKPGANPLAREPLFADIIGRAQSLKADVEALQKGLAGGAASLDALPRFTPFKARIAALADLDMKGHLELARRGTDGDLKCILRGISQDLPRKLDDMTGAKDAAARDLALREMAYLLVDNVEVITAPPAPPV
jgi:hypothetical protein